MVTWQDALSDIFFGQRQRILRTGKYRLQRKIRTNTGPTSRKSSPVYNTSRHTHPNMHPQLKFVYRMNGVASSDRSTNCSNLYATFSWLSMFEQVYYIFQVKSAVEISPNARVQENTSLNQLHFLTQCMCKFMPWDCLQMPSSLRARSTSSGHFRTCFFFQPL